MVANHNPSRRLRATTPNGPKVVVCYYLSLAYFFDAIYELRYPLMFAAPIGFFE